MPTAFAGLADPLSQPGFDRVLDALSTGAPEIWAVLTVETHGCGFLADRRPLILFERHVFSRRTRGVHDATHPSISSSTPGGYLGGAREYDRLDEAIGLDRQAALDSTSWGIGQVMGFNFAAAGFRSTEAMVAASMDGEDAQLSGMANFLRGNRLQQPLARHDWQAFARGYNGPDFAKNHYAERLQAAFNAFSSGPLPDLVVRQTQVLLMFLGIDTGVVDGILGRRTRSGIRLFREQSALPAGESIDDVFLAALRAAVRDITDGTP